MGMTHFQDVNESKQMTGVHLWWNTCSMDVSDYAVNSSHSYR